MKVLIFIFSKLIDWVSMILVPISIILQALMQTTGQTVQSWELIISLFLGASAGTYLANKVEHLNTKEIYLRFVFAFGTGYAARNQFVNWLPGWDKEFVHLIAGFSMLVILSIALKFLKDFEVKSYLNKIFEQKMGIDEENKKEKDNV